MISEDQLRVGEIALRGAMALIAFVSAALATLFFLVVLMLCIRKHDDWAATIVVGVVNGFLLSIDLIIYKSLFVCKGDK